MVGDAKSEAYLIKSCSLSCITEVFLWVLEVFGIGFHGYYVFWFGVFFSVDLPVIRF